MDLADFVGQRHLLSPEAPFYKLLIQKALPHSLFFGPPGSGKTTLARIIAKIYGSDFYEFNATSLKIEEIRKVVTKYQGSLIQPILFIDEIHRLSRNQQEVLLPLLEKDGILFLGASTENPLFSLTQAMRSRLFLFEFKSLSDDELNTILKRVLLKAQATITKEAQEYILHLSQGDARNLIKFISTAAKVEKEITLQTLKALASQSYHEGRNESHYELLSAFIKSVRGSDIDASLYYLARLVENGEPADLIARRLVILASEDIGNANPNALNLATSTLLAVKNIGYPEAKIILSQCTIYLASSPKSDAAYKAIKKAQEVVRNGLLYPIPSFLKAHQKGYKNPHDFGGFVEQKYMAKKMKFYESRGVGFEKRLNEWIEKIRRL